MSYVKFLLLILVYAIQAESLHNPEIRAAAKILSEEEQKHDNLNLENQFFINYLDDFENSISLLDNLCAEKLSEKADNYTIQLGTKFEYLNAHFKNTDEGEFQEHKDRFVLLESKYHNALTTCKTRLEQEKIVSDQKLKLHQKLANRLFRNFAYRR